MSWKPDAALPLEKAFFCDLYFICCRKQSYKNVWFMLSSNRCTHNICSPESLLPVDSSHLIPSHKAPAEVQAQIPCRVSLYLFLAVATWNIADGCGMCQEPGARQQRFTLSWKRGLHWDSVVLKWSWSAMQPSPCWVPSFSSMVSLKRRKWNQRGSWLNQFL